MWWLSALGLVACVPMEPSGNVIAPADPGPASVAGPPIGAGPQVGARTTAPAPAGRRGAGPGAASGPQGDFDFEAEDRDAGLVADAPASEDPLALQAKLLGVSVEEARLQSARAAATGALPPVAAPMWDPSVTIPEASFGIRVLAVVLDLQPPRAVISLPDGREQVVTPGAMLPAEGLVVLAIGRDAVQIAKVTPSGFFARVETDTIRALYPSQPNSP